MQHELRRTQWLARAVLAGFCATIVMIVTYFYAYALAIPMARAHLANAHGALGDGIILQNYFENLIHNPLVNFAHNALYAALALHFFVGISLAVVYAFVEPRLSGRGFVRGMMFSLVPWILSLVVFMPLVGAGFLGLAIGAGGLPIIGNLILHLAYGATLGAVYAPSSEQLLARLADEAHVQREQIAMRRAEHGAVFGLGIGLVVGLALGILLMLTAQVTHVYIVLGLPDGWYLVASTLTGGCLGALVGSLAALPTDLEPPTLTTATIR